MRTLIREWASAPLGPELTPRESRYEAEPAGLLTCGEVGAFDALTWLTVAPLEEER